MEMEIKLKHNKDKGNAFKYKFSMTLVFLKLSASYSRVVKWSVLSGISKLLLFLVLHMPMDIEDNFGVPAAFIKNTCLAKYTIKLVSISDVLNPDQGYINHLHELLGTCTVCLSSVYK